ncbi:EAL domain-containing protein [Jiella sp. MQZ9-1]|uniref:EAL domain-containing protein n=1 Tax=Jiella flava TaxID=2816857 RepID=A0A939FYP2_9HYPH|nr:EAL domain-containing protein [Jiella flava]MBO0661952.1 EAL domain-containing protein [Jiella flava]MCD2470720.1 EAL domain-containing protein [Jiella flava]
MEKVWLDQLDLSLRLAPFTILTGVSVSIVVCFFFWERQTMTYLVGQELAVAGLGAFGLAGCVAWRKDRLLARGVCVGTIRRRLIIIAALGGITLASIPLMLFEAAGAEGRLLIASTCAGLIATGICIGFVPAAGLVYSGGIIVGSFVALARTGEDFYLIVAVLLTIYTCFIVITIVQISRLVSLRAIVQIDLDRQRELSGLLLNDFEQNASDWLWETDAAGLIRTPSNRFAEVTELARAELQGLPFIKLFTPVDSEPVDSEQRLRLALAEHRPFRRLRMPVIVDTDRRWWSLTGKPIHDADGVFLGFRGVGSDVTLEHEYIARLNYLANHDVLTRLANRRHFEEIVSEAETRLAAGQPGADYAVLCLDLDRFKQVNDTFGHSVGDELLRQIGKRLTAFSGPDRTIARFAGDEFALLHADSTLTANADLAERIVASLRQPYMIEDLYLNIDVSIGIAIARMPTSALEILRQADAALYRMKSAGGGSYRVYDPSMDEHKEERATLMGELRGALERGEFTLSYQPIVLSKTGKLHGFEALMRWRHPVHGPVPPNEFIALAEETGTIIALGEWGLFTACCFAASWPDRSLSVAVNISTVQIRHTDLVDLVSRALAVSKLEASRLELEITETAFLAANKETSATLQQLRELGVRLALDDFGTGYSSLSYLRELPIDKIKIDRSFIIDLPHKTSDVSIVKTIVELGRTLKMTTIAEGVETRAQLDCLRQIGCPELQGYLFGPPADEHSTLALIKQSDQRPVSLVAG